MVRILFCNCECRYAIKHKNTIAWLLSDYASVLRKFAGSSYHFLNTTVNIIPIKQC